MIRPTTLRGQVSRRDATAADIEHVARNLRAADVVELSLARKAAPADTVRLGAARSVWARVLCVDDQPAVLYGVAPLGLPDCGSPWMVATEGIEAISRAFLMASRDEIARMRLEFRLLFNQVHRDNDRSIKWLRWLEFEIDFTPTGPDGQFFNFWQGDMQCAIR